MPDKGWQLSDFKFFKRNWKIVEMTILYNTENTICTQHVYTSHIQYKMYTKWKIQPKVGVLGAGLEVLHHSLR